MFPVYTSLQKVYKDKKVADFLHLKFSHQFQQLKPWNQNCIQQNLFLWGGPTTDFVGVIMADNGDIGP